MAASMDQSVDIPSDNALAGLGEPIVCDRLFDLVLRFNLFPAEYAHPGWLAMLDKVLPGIFSFDDEIRRTGYRIRSLSRALLALCNAEHSFDFDFSDSVKRIALLPCDCLSSLGMHVASVLAQPHLQKFVNKEQVRAINQAIGSEVRLFSLRWCAQQGFASTQVGALGNAVAGHLFETDRFQQCAMQLVLTLIPEEASAVSTRLILKYPVAWKHITPFRLNVEQRSALSALFASVLKQKWPVFHQQLWDEVHA